VACRLLAGSLAWASMATAPFGTIYGAGFESPQPGHPVVCVGLELACTLPRPIQGLAVMLDECDMLKWAGRVRLPLIWMDAGRRDGRE
jgi:hypothetical protein